MPKLRILCCDPPGGAFYHITKAWGRAFEQLGHTFTKWDGKENSWRKFNPHLYLGCSGHRQPIPKGTKTKVGIHVNPHGKIRLNPLHGVDVNEPGHAVKWSVSMKPDFVFGYGIQQDEKTFWSKYKSDHNIPWFGVPTAGDPFHYYKDPDESLVCDIGFVGGRWSYKLHNLDKYLVPLFKKYNYKCFGWGGWEGICESKELPDNTDVDRKLFSSAKICPAICEPHTTKYSIDWPERIFKIPLCNGFTVSDPVANFDRYLPTDVFPMSSNLVELCDYYLKNEDERKQLADKQMRFILENHTYINRIHTLFVAAGFKQEAKDALNFKDKLIERRLNVQIL